MMGKFVRKCCTVESLKSKLPITKWLPKYRVRDLQSDVISGLTVALTVIPQGLAYAKIANLPPQYGLYSAFMGCFVYTFLGTSKDITLGPTAIMSLMTASFARSPVENDATYAIILSVVCGVVQLLMGILHLGIIVSFFSYPVINAFTSAAAITIAFGQLKGILGLKNIPIEFVEMVYETFKHIPDTKVWDLTMGLSSLVVLFFLKKLRTIKWKDNPNGEPLRITQRIGRKLVWLLGTGANAVVVFVSSGIVAIMISQGLDDKLSITGYITPGLPPFKVPSFTLTTGNTTLGIGDIFEDIGAGLGIVPLLGLVETVAIGKAFARQNNYKIQPNQELIATGTANLVSSFVSSYPVTGSFSRTAVNSQSGVRTPAAGIVTGVMVLLALQVMTPLFYYIPKSALSAVIISAVIQMVDYKIVLKLWRSQRWDLLPLFATFISCLGLGIEYGILVGIGVSILMLLYPMSRPRLTMEGKDPVIISFNHGLKFPAVEFVQEKITKAMIEDGISRSVILDCSCVSAVDSTTIQGLIEMVASFTMNDSVFVLACLKQEIEKELTTADIPHLLIAKDVGEAKTLIQDQKKADEVSVKMEDPAPDSVPTVNGQIFFTEHL